MSKAPYIGNIATFGKDKQQTCGHDVFCPEILTVGSLFIVCVHTVILDFPQVLLWNAALWLTWADTPFATGPPKGPGWPQVIDSFISQTVLDMTSRCVQNFGVVPWKLRSHFSIVLDMYQLLVVLLLFFFCNCLAGEIHDYILEIAITKRKCLVLVLFIWREWCFSKNSRFFCVI